MFKFDIEETIKELEGLSLLEKVEKISDLYDELEDAHSEVQNLQDEVTKEYEDSITGPLTTSVEKFIKERQWDKHFSVHKDYYPVFTIESEKAKVKLAPAFQVGFGWFIQIEPSNHESNNPLDFKIVPELETAMAALMNGGNDEMRVYIKENELQPTVERIIIDFIEKCDN
jgi:hypothetical protein